MASPKRLFLLLVGFAIFFACYQVYAFFLGKYDGLPPLPAEYQRVENDDDAPPIAPVTRPNHAVARLVEAFGPNCEEQYRRIKLEWRIQGVVVAADRWQLLDNGQLRLFKVSVALFGKPKADQRGVEINTIRGEQADIEFDKPITDRKDAFNRKPVAGRLVGKGMKVELRNNRRTPRPEDDVRLYTDWLAYSDKEHRIWTDAEVRLVDSEPEQARVTALGLEVGLIPAEPEREPTGKGKNKARPPEPPASSKKGTVSGVKYVRLGKDVCMNLQIDARSAFLGKPAQPAQQTPMPADKPAAPAAESQPAAQQRTPIVVTSQGPFHYDVENDRADFSDTVTVIRKLEVQPAPMRPGPQIRYDQLDCDKLTLLFVRKKDDLKAAAADDQDLALDLLRAEATGTQIELASDAEKLHATGTELIYDKANNQTIMRGNPITADRDGNELEVFGTLVFQNPTDDRKEIQEARAEGRGIIRIRNTEGLAPDDAAKQASKPVPERVARWQREMRISKEGPLDRLDFIGQASFEDPEQGTLRGEQIAVWLEDRALDKPPDKPGQPPEASGGGKKTGSNRRPRRLEAVKNVSLESVELRIPQTDYLRLQFEEADLSGHVDSLRPRTADRPGPGKAEDKPAPAGPKPALANQADQGKVGGQHEVLPAGKDVTKEPLVLKARTVDVKVLVDGKRAELKEVRTEGDVLVTRKAETPRDPAVEIRGDRLDLFHNEQGNVLKVTGQPGYVHLDRLTLLGPVVNIDQPANQAWVNGGGSMKLPSKTDFQGNPLKEPIDVTVYWTERMFFDGKIAEFDGNVQAEQGDPQGGGASLACRKLEVVLDQTVSLKETQGPRGEQPAALYRMLCDQDCRLEKGVRNGDRWEQYQRIEGREVLFDNPSSQLNVYGPGLVTMLHEGSTGDLTGGTPMRSAPARERGQASETKLTRIQFGGHMQANKASGVVIFTERIQLSHVPGATPDAVIDPDKLPVGGLWLACNKLKAVSRRIDEKTVAQEFEATDRVRILGRLASGEFSGTADLVKYVESKDLLILEGQNGNYATLTRQVAPGRPKEPVQAKRIWYWRSLNQVKLDETNQIQVSPGR